MGRLASKAGWEEPAHATPAAVAAGMPVGGIVFDVPDVLHDATLWRRWLVQLVGRMGIRLSYANFCRAWDERLVDVHRGRREYDEALETLLLDLGLSWAQVDEIEAASRIQRQNLELGVRPWPGVGRTVDELARLGLQLGAWADSPLVAGKLAERLARLLGHTSFDAVLTSFDLESTQPDARCYRAVLDLLSLSAAETVYVGHDTAHLAGARAAGLRTVAFNYESAAQADHYLTGFDDLVGLAKSWSIMPRPLSGAFSSSPVSK